MKYFILGGSGFIGSNLADYLLKQGHDVMIYDNFITSNEYNLKDAFRNGASMCMKDGIEFQIKNSDFIYHLAASVGVDYVENNPLQTMKNNLEMELSIFNLCEKYNKPLLFASTSEVYGNSKEIPFKETQDLSIGNPTRHRYGYACSKLMGEHLAMSSKFPSIIVRFFNVTGPRQLDKYGMVFPTFLNKAKNNERLTIYGDGNQTRCFCHIYDAVDALYKLSINKKCYNQVYNIGNPNNKISMIELAKKINIYFHNHIDVYMKDYAKQFHKNSCDIIHRVPSIDKIKKDIDWEPTRTISNIIEDML